MENRLAEQLARIEALSNRVEERLGALDRAKNTYDLNSRTYSSTITDKYITTSQWTWTFDLDRKKKISDGQILAAIRKMETALMKDTPHYFRWGKEPVGQPEYSDVDSVIKKVGFTMLFKEIGPHNGKPHCHTLLTVAALGNSFLYVQYRNFAELALEMLKDILPDGLSTENITAGMRVVKSKDIVGATAYLSKDSVSIGGRDESYRAKWYADAKRKPTEGDVITIDSQSAEEEELDEDDEDVEIQDVSEEDDDNDDDGSCASGYTSPPPASPASSPPPAPRKATGKRRMPAPAPKKVAKKQTRSTRRK